jgi:class 3 adenylate cyclase/predicted ATPase
LARSNSASCARRRSAAERFGNPDAAMSDEVGAWLASLGLERYATVFAENDITFAVLSDLNDQDLRELGVSLGHRKRLLKALAEMRATSGDRLATFSAERAERRQLTVMFADLVGSTELAVRYDVEDLREIVMAFQNSCERVVRSFEGNVARHMGDGLLVYFGYPEADEYGAERSLRAGLEIVRAIGELAVRPGLRMQTRVGIATGEVVVGDLIGDGSAREQAVVGQTPNLAQRLQALASPDEVVISDVTRRLAGGLFEYVDLGLHRLKGFAVPVLAWRVAGEIEAATRFDALHDASRLTPLVGRDDEVLQLLEMWRAARDGKGRAVLVIGDPGIGKSRIALKLRQQLAGTPHASLAFSCNLSNRDSALFPVISRLEHAAGFARGDTANTKLDKLEALIGGHSPETREVVGLCSALLSVSTAGRYPPLDLSPKLQKERIFDALLDLLARLTRDRPVLTIVEDVHWLDPTSRELLERVVAEVPKLPMLLLLTARPEFRSPWSEAECTTLRLSRLQAEQSTQMVHHVAGGKTLPAGVLDTIIAKTDGVPLFIEELTKTVLESGLLEERDDTYALKGPMPDLAIPNTLQDSLMARLDRLSEGAKELAQIGAAVGRQFSYELLAAVAPQGPDEFRAALEQLTTVDLVQREGTPPRCVYTFRHALIQEAAYSRLVRAKRRRLHHEIAAALEKHFPETMDERPELLAHHHASAGQAPKAIPYLRRAAELATDRAAHAQALVHVETALELLGELPDDDHRKQLELGLRIALGINLEATGGYAAEQVQRTYARARELCDELGHTVESVPVLLGLYVFHLVRADHAVARELAAQCMELSEASGRVDYLIDSCAALGHVLPFLGELEAGRPILERCADLSGARRGGAVTRITAQDPAIASLAQLGVVLWMLGYPQRAVEQIDRAFALAGDLAQPINVALVCPYAAELRQLRGESVQASAVAARGRQVAGEHGYDYWGLLSTMHLGIAKGTLGELEEASILTGAGLNALRGSGAEANLAYFLYGIAQVELGAGDVERAWGTASQAFLQAERTHEFFFQSLLHQLRGEIAIARSSPDERAAEADFVRALEIAREQRAKLPELRAMNSLHRLHRKQRRAAESRAQLAELRDWFTEGFETVDLQTASVLLAEP